MSTELIEHSTHSTAGDRDKPTLSRPNMPMLGLLALGHMVIDINAGAVAALLPFLKSALALSYTSAGVIVLASNATSSLIQPIFGYFADKNARRWILPVSVFLSTVGIALTGLANSYALVLTMIVVSGIGVASYHPEGYRSAAQMAGSRKATGVSIFSIGGNIGIALGPPLIALLVTGYGLRGTLGMLIPGLLVTILMSASLPRLSGEAVASTHKQASGARKTNLYAMTILIFVVALRSWTQGGFATFVPFYYLEVLHGDPRMVGTLLTIFLGSGALGTLVAGPIADRIGVRRYAIGVFLLATPLAAAFLMTRGILSYVLLGALGFVLVSTFTITVVLAHAYMPRNLGMASGFIVGFATGAGGLGVTVLGWVADQWGLITALWISALMPLAAFAVSLFLPEPEKS